MHAWRLVVGRPLSGAHPYSAFISAPRLRSLHSSAPAWDSPSEHASPIARYDALVDKGLLREDSHQRTVVERLETLHDELKTYEQRLHPEKQSISPGGSHGFVSVGAST